MWQCHHQLFPLPLPLAQDYHCLLPGIIALPWLPVLCFLIRSTHGVTQGSFVCFPELPGSLPFPTCCLIPQSTKSILRGHTPLSQTLLLGPGRHPRWFLRIALNPPSTAPTHFQYVPSLSPADFALVPTWTKTGHFAIVSCGTGNAETHLMAPNARKSFSVLVPKLKHQERRDQCEIVP